MAITYQGIIARSAKNSKGKRTYTHVHKLNVGSKAEAKEYLVGSNTSLPVIGSVHPDDPYAYCVSLSVDMVTMYADWQVTAEYEQNEWIVNENPLDDDAAIDWDGENYEEPMLIDNAGDAVLNSAGDFFQNLMRERTRRVVTITKNIAAIPSWIIDSEDAVNSSAFLLDGFSVPAGKAKLAAPRIGRWQTRNNISFREMTMKITLNRDGWNAAPLDAGFRYRNGSSELVKIVSDDGTDITQAAPLNGSGGVLSNPTPSTAVFLDFDVYPAYDFNNLPLS